MSELSKALTHGTRASSELCEALGISPPTLMRRVRSAHDAVVRIGRARRTRYGLLRTVHALGASEWNLYRIEPTGMPHPVGRLVALVSDETAWLPAGAVFAGLPEELDDMKPQGFLGRSFAAHHRELGVPPRVIDWTNDNILTALARRGEDAPGNLMLGDESLERWSAQQVSPLDRGGYPRMAERALAGEPVGSSAGGEQPKFGAFVDGRHVLVKFASRSTDVGERWGDLLVLEHLALETLRDNSVPAVETRVIQAESFRFLEIERFDRVGVRGRRAVLSLSAAWQAPHLRWSVCARQLHEARQLDERDAATLALYDAYGQLIGNTDRHHFNVLLFPQHDASTAQIERYHLAPAFDQLPMMFAPRSGGAMITTPLNPGAPVAEVWGVWNDAVRMARQFWNRAANENRISEALRVACRASEQSLTNLDV